MPHECNVVTLVESRVRICCTARSWRICVANCTDKLRAGVVCWTRAHDQDFPECRVGRSAYVTIIQLPLLRQSRSCDPWRNNNVATPWGHTLMASRLMLIDRIFPLASRLRAAPALRPHRGETISPRVPLNNVLLRRAARRRRGGFVSLQAPAQANASSLTRKQRAHRRATTFSYASVRNTLQRTIFRPRACLTTLRSLGIVVSNIVHVVR